MTSVTPLREEAGELIPRPGGVTWRLAADARLMAGSGYALLLQVSHPVVGAGVAQHSDFKADPWGRLLRTLDFTTSVVYGGPSLAWSTCRRVRAMHRQIKGTLPDGSPYHSLEPEAFAWVHATLADAIIRSHEHFIGPVSQSERQAFWGEWKRAGRLLGVRDRDLPGSWSEFETYFELMATEQLCRTTSVDDVLDALAKPPPPGIRGMNDSLWKAMRVPAARGARLGTVGLLSPSLRDKLGLEWTLAQERELRAVAFASRRSGPLLPAAVKEMFGPRYLRWRGEAIARGDVASGASQALA